MDAASAETEGGILLASRVPLAVIAAVCPECSKGKRGTPSGLSLAASAAVGVVFSGSHGSHSSSGRKFELSPVREPSYE